MHAVVMTDIGPPEVLQPQEMEEPQISTPTQIKVRLHAAGVNPIDTKIRQRGLFYGAQPPAILGCDGAGEVVEVGDQVNRFQVGDLVWFCHGGLGREQGNYAEYTVLEESRAEFKPARITMTEAAGGPLVLITAWEALFDRGHLKEGQVALIHAGAGGVGHVAIQLAKLAGAKVIATVSTPEKAGLARNLGADAVIDYRNQDLAQAVAELTGGQGVDLVFDTVGPEVFRASIGLLAEYGTLVTILDPGPFETKEARNRNLTIAFTLMLTPALKDLPEALAHQGEILRRCGEWLAEEKMKIHVGQTLPLDQAAEAHRIIEAGHATGKIVLEI